MIASTRGLIADLTESAVDFLVGTSGIAKQTGYEMKNNPNNNYVSFSQGTLISKSGMNYYGLKENMVDVGTPLYRNFDNGVNINSSLDPVHNPLVIFNPNSWKSKDYGGWSGIPILYEHVNYVIQKASYYDEINKKEDIFKIVKLLIPEIKINVLGKDT